MICKDYAKHIKASEEAKMWSMRAKWNGKRSYWVSINGNEFSIYGTAKCKRGKIMK